MKDIFIITLAFGKFQTQLQCNYFIERYVNKWMKSFDNYDNDHCSYYYIVIKFTTLLKKIYYYNKTQQFCHHSHQSQIYGPAGNGEKSTVPNVHNNNRSNHNCYEILLTDKRIMHVMIL